MKANIKGMKVNVSVNVSIKAEEINNDNFCKSGGRDRRDNDSITGLDLGLGASIDMGIESIEGDIDLRELGDIINKSLSDEIGRQIKEQMRNNEETSSESEEQKEDDTEEK